MTDPILQPVETPEQAPATREKSTIGFPYDDLTAAINVAKAVHDLGDRCGHDQLAPQLKYSSVDNGAYRLAVGVARHFGLIGSDRDGVTLTALGHRIVDRASPLVACGAACHSPVYLRLPRCLMQAGTSAPARAFVLSRAW